MNQWRAEGGRRFEADNLRSFEDDFLIFFFFLTKSLLRASKILTRIFLYFIQFVGIFDGPRAASADRPEGEWTVCHGLIRSLPGYLGDQCYA
jgi:hypothetical protein